MEDKKALLQKVLDLKLKKSEVETAVGLPKNSLSAMCKGKKELPDKYVSVLQSYLLQVERIPLLIPMSYIDDAGGDVEKGKVAYLKFLESERQKRRPNDTQRLYDVITAGIKEAGGDPLKCAQLRKDIIHIVAPELMGSLVERNMDLLDHINLSPVKLESFDCERMPSNMLVEFPQYKTGDPVKVAKLDDALNALANDKSPLRFGPRWSFDPSVIESFLKSKDITPEQLIEGYKSWANRMSGIVQAVKEQEKNPPIITTTNTPQGLTPQQLEIRKKKMGY